MVRLISVILLILGLGIAAFGGFRMYSGDVGGAPEASALPPPPPAPEPVAVEVAPATGSGAVIAEPVVVDNSIAAAPRARSGISRSANAPEPVFSAASAPVAAPAAAPESSVTDELMTVPIAYETPAAAEIGKVFTATFALDGTGDTTAADALSGDATTAVIEGEARVSDRIRASLVGGSAFEVELLSPDIQGLSRETENIWRWNVRPTKAGEHALIVELFALEGDEARPVRTFREKVVVNVSPLQRAIGMANTANPIVMVLGGIGSALGGFFGVFKFFRRIP